jgi:hypothetical protein
MPDGSIKDMGEVLLHSSSTLNGLRQELQLRSPPRSFVPSDVNRRQWYMAVGIEEAAAAVAAARAGNAGGSVAAAGVSAAAAGVSAAAAAGGGSPTAAGGRRGKRQDPDLLLLKDCLGPGKVATLSFQQKGWFHEAMGLSD